MEIVWRGFQLTSHSDWNELISRVLVCVRVFACLTYMKFVAQIIPGFNRIKYSSNGSESEKKKRKKWHEKFFMLYNTTMFYSRCVRVCACCAHKIIDAKSFTLLLIKFFAGNVILNKIKIPFCHHINSKRSFNFQLNYGGRCYHHRKFSMLF